MAGVITGLRTRSWMKKAHRLLRAHDFDGAAGWCEAILEIDRRHAAARALAKEIPSQAVTHCRSVCQQSPDDLDASLAFITWLLEAAGYDEAAAELQHAEALAASGPKAASELELTHIAGRVRYHQGDLRGALACLEQARVPSHLLQENHYYSGLCHMALGEAAPAVRYFRRIADEFSWAIRERLEELAEKLGETDAG